MCSVISNPKLPPLSPSFGAFLLEGSDCCVTAGLYKEQDHEDIARGLQYCKLFRKFFVFILA
jgi:hypothetical protein